MKKQHLGRLLCLALCLTMLPTVSALETPAQDDNISACSCTQACTPDAIYADCLTCMSQGTALDDVCLGQSYVALANITSMLSSLPSPESVSEETREYIEAKLAEIDDAKLELSDEHRELVDYSRYNALVDALNALDGEPDASFPEPIGDAEQKSLQSMLNNYYSVSLDKDYNDIYLDFRQTTAQASDLLLNDHKIDKLTFNIYGNLNILNTYSGGNASSAAVLSNAYLTYLNNTNKKLDLKIDGITLTKSRLTLAQTKMLLKNTNANAKVSLIGSSELTVDGSTITGDNSGLLVLNNSKVTINSGTVDYIDISSDASITITGGTIGKKNAIFEGEACKTKLYDATITGGHFIDIFVDESSISGGEFEEISSNMLPAANLAEGYVFTKNGSPVTDVSQTTLKNVKVARSPYTFGNITASDTSVNTNKNITLSAGSLKENGSEVSGVTYQWYVSKPNSTVYDKIEGATSKTLTTTQSKGGYYYYAVTASKGSYAYAATKMVRFNEPEVTNAPEPRERVYTGSSQTLISSGTASGGSMYYSLYADKGFSTELPCAIAPGTYKVYYYVSNGSQQTAIEYVTAEIAEFDPAKEPPTLKIGNASHTYSSIASSSRLRLSLASYEGDRTYTSESGYLFGAPITYYITMPSGNAVLPLERVALNELDVGTYKIHAVIGKVQGTKEYKTNTVDMTITQKAASATVKLKNDLVYTGELIDLVDYVICGDGCQRVEFSMARNGQYSSFQSIIKGSDAKRYIVYLKFVPDGSGNYSQNITELSTVIDPKDITYTVSSSKTYDGSTDAVLTITGFDGKCEGDSLEVTGTLVGSFDNKNVGTSKSISGIKLRSANDVTVTGADKNNYNIILPRTATGEITAKEIYVSSAEFQDKQYDGDTRASVDTLSFNDLITGEQLVLDRDYEIISASFEDSNIGRNKPITFETRLMDTDIAKNYTLSSERSLTSSNATISAKPVTATVHAQDKVYDGDDTVKSIAASVSQDQLITGDSITIEGLVATFSDENAENDKQVTIDLSGMRLIGAENYNVTVPTSTTASITKANAKVNTAPIGEEGLIYKARDLKLIADGGSCEGGTIMFGLNNTDKDSMTSQSDDITGKHADDYTVYYYVKGDRNHYDTSVDSITVAIAKKALSVTAKPKSIVYGDLPENDGVSYSGFEGDDDESALSGTLSYDYSYERYEDIGDFDITPKGYTSNDYDISFYNGKLKVEPKEIGISWSNTSPIYTGQAQKPTATATKLVNNDSCNITVIGEQTDAADGYIATASSVDNSNYKLPLNNTTEFSILKATLADVSAEQSQPLTYNGKYQAASVATSATTVDGSSVIFTYSTEENGEFTTSVPAFTTGTNTVYYQAEAANHHIYSSNFEVTINKAMLTITAQNKKVYVFSRPLDLTSPLEYTDYIIDGLIGNDKLGAETRITLSCDAQMGRVGKYEIIPSVIGTDARYDFKFVNGILFVDPAPGILPISFKIEPVAGNGGSIFPADTLRVEKGYDAVFRITPDEGYAIDDIIVDGKSVGAVKSYTFTDVRRDHTIEVIFAPKADEPISDDKENADSPINFSDVPAGSWFEKAVAWALENDITSGISSTLFAPDAGCTRAQAVTFLWRAHGSPSPSHDKLPFVDVPEDSYYRTAVLWALENGITSGTSESTFAPDQLCTRAQIVTFIWRSLAGFIE